MKNGKEGDWDHSRTGTGKHVCVDEEGDRGGD